MDLLGKCGSATDWMMKKIVWLAENSKIVNSIGPGQPTRSAQANLARYFLKCTPFFHIARLIYYFQSLNQVEFHNISKREKAKVGGKTQNIKKLNLFCRVVTFTLSFVTMQLFWGERRARSADTNVQSNLALRSPLNQLKSVCVNRKLFKTCWD